MRARERDPSAKHYRDLAAYCREMAAQETESGIKEALLKLARDYEELAVKLESARR